MASPFFVRSTFPNADQMSKSTICALSINKWIIRSNGGSAGSYLSKYLTTTGAVIDLFTPQTNNEWRRQNTHDKSSCRRYFNNSSLGFPITEVGSSKGICPQPILKFPCRRSVVEQVWGDNQGRKHWECILWPVSCFLLATMLFLRGGLRKRADLANRWNDMRWAHGDSQSSCSSINYTRGSVLNHIL